MIAFLLAAIAAALFILAHRQAARTTPDQIERARRVFVISHFVACTLLLAAGANIAAALFTPLVIGATIAGLIGFAARCRLIAFGTRRRDWILRGPLFTTGAILLAITGPPWVIGAVFTSIAMMAFRWKKDVPTRRVFAFGLIALVLAVIGFWRVGALPDGRDADALAGAQRALWGFANALRWSSAFFCAAGAFAMLLQFVRDPSLGVRRVSRRLALSHILVVVVPLLLMSLLWAATTLLGVSRDRALVAARAIQTEADGLESALRSALAEPDPTPALRALGGTLERRIPGTRVWRQESRGLVRLHGAPIAREDSLVRWLDSLTVLNPKGVVARESTWVGAAVKGVHGAGIILVPAESVRVAAARIAGADVELQAGSFRRNDAIDRDSLDADVDSLIASAAGARRDDSLETERVRRITRRFGVPDSVVQTDRNRPRAGITIDGERFDNRRRGGPDTNPLLSGYATVHGNSERRTGWRKSQALVRVSLAPGKVLAGLFSTSGERGSDPFALLPLILVSALAVAFGLVALWDILMVASMGRGVADAIGALHGAARRMESGDLAHRIEVRGDDDLWDVARAFNQASAGLARARDAEQERARLENELALARRIQARLLPAGPPEIAGLEIAGASESAREVGGDYFDHIDLGGGRVALVIADVSGKGVGAALLMSAFRASLVSHDLSGADPAHLAVRLNGFLHHSVDPGKFVTAFVGFLDAATGALHYVNAGHNPPLLLRATGAPEWLHEGGTILGILPSSTFTSGVATLAPGDLLALYTDGVTEGADARGEMWGEERLVATLGRLRDRPCAAIVQELVSEVRTFEGESGPADDITVLVARRN